MNGKRTLLWNKLATFISRLYGATMTYIGSFEDLIRNTELLSKLLFEGIAT